MRATGKGFNEDGHWEIWFEQRSEGGKEASIQVFRESIESGRNSKMQVRICLAFGETARRPVQLVCLNYCDSKLTAPSVSTIPPPESILNSEPEWSLQTDILKSLYVCPFDKAFHLILSKTIITEWPQSPTWYNLFSYLSVFTSSSSPSSSFQSSCTMFCSVLSSTHILMKGLSKG